MKFAKYVFVFLAVLLTLVIDRLTKFYVLKKLPTQGVFLINKNDLKLQLISSVNQKLSFSLPAPQWLIIILSFFIIIALAWLLIYKLKNKKFFYSAILSIIICGATSNLFDRFYYQGVVDFISIKFYNFQWAIFNFADIFITLGIIVMLILELMPDKSITSKYDQ